MLPILVLLLREWPLLSFSMTLVTSHQCILIAPAKGVFFVTFAENCKLYIIYYIMSTPLKLLSLHTTYYYTGSGICTSLSVGYCLV